MKAGCWDKIAECGEGGGVAREGVGAGRGVGQRGGTHGGETPMAPYGSLHTRIEPFDLTYSP